MKLEFLLAGVVATGLFASTPNAVALPAPPHPPAGHPPVGLHGGLPHEGAGLHDLPRLADTRGNFKDLEGHRPSLDRARSLDRDPSSNRDRFSNRDRSSERDRSNDKDNSSGKDKDSSSGKDKDSSSGKDKDSSSDKDKDGYSDKDKDRYHDRDGSVSVYGYAGGGDGDDGYYGDDSSSGDSSSGDSSSGDSSSSNSSSSNSSKRDSSKRDSSKGGSYGQTSDASASMLKVAQLATKDIQAELGRLGYYHAPIDGVPRPETIDAIRSFQADQGLPVTGQVDPNLIGALLSRSNAK